MSSTGDAGAERRRRAIRRATLYTYGFLGAALLTTVGGAALVAWILSFTGLPFLTTWLVLMARRLCIDRDRTLHGRAPAEDDSDQVLQRQARRRLAELAAEEVDLDSIAAESGATPEHQVRQFELKQALEQALGTLDHRDRLLLTYRYVDKLSAQEIARLQQWPSHLHVYRRITHVCGLLRRELERRGVESSVP